MSTPSAIEAALELQEFLDRQHLSFCVIGGVALQRWGETRMTSDADATVLTHWVNDESVTDLLLSHFATRIPKARAFGLQHRVLLLQTASGVALDIALGALPFEQNAVARSSRVRATSRGEQGAGCSRRGNRRGSGSLVCADLASVFILCSGVAACEKLSQ